MGGYIGTKVGSLAVTAAEVSGDITSTDASPELTLKNTTHEDTDGGRESKVTFKGEQSGGEESTLAEIEASHDGTADDQKGSLIFKTNDGSDNAAPTYAAKIDSGRTLLVGKTEDGFSNAGHAFFGGGDVYHIKDGNAALYAKRLSSDGDIIKLFKDSAHVGGISSRDGVATNVILRTATGQGAGIGGANSGVLPCDEDGLQDAEINLGASGTRWKDLHLSNHIYIQSADLGSVGTFGRNTDGSQRTLLVFRSESQNATVGTITVSNTSTAYNTSSDYRLKENVVNLTGATERLKQLEPKRFNFIADADTTVDGFLAHEAATVIPEAVSGEKDAMTEEVLYVDGDEIPEGKKVGDVKIASTIDAQGIDQSKLVPLLTAALQEAIAKIETLETKVAALEG